MRLTNKGKELIKGLEKVKELKELADAVVRAGGPDIKRGIDFPYRRWTIFKLIAHLLYTPLYTSIIEKYFAEFYYVDLFSGSGLGYISEEDVKEAVRTFTGTLRIAGSPLIPLSIVRKPFSRIYLNDMDQNKILLLRKRIEAASAASKNLEYKRWFPFQIDSSRIRIYSLDANLIIDTIVKEIEGAYESLIKSKNKGCHAYFFIDPSGLEFKRKSLEKILKSKVRNDIMILFNSYGAALQAYNHIKFDQSDAALRKCLGDSYEEHIENHAKSLGKKKNDLTIRELADALLGYYQEIFRAHNYEVVSVKLSLIEPTIAKSETQEREFDLIYATKKTKQGNPYINGFLYIKSLVEEFANKIGYSTIINMFIEYMATGELPGLLKLIIKDPEAILSQYSTYKRFGLS